MMLWHNKYSCLPAYYHINTQRNNKQLTMLFYCPPPPPKLLALARWHFAWRYCEILHIKIQFRILSLSLTFFMSILLLFLLPVNKLRVFLSVVWVPMWRSFFQFTLFFAQPQFICILFHSRVLCIYICLICSIWESWEYNIKLALNWLVSHLKANQ